MFHDIEFSNCDSPVINGIRIPAIGFADDIGGLSCTAEGLQRLLNCVMDHINWIDMVVNTLNSKVIVFRNSPQTVVDLPNFTLGMHTLDIVDTFPYLGLLLSKYGISRLSIDDRIQKATRSLNALWAKLWHMGHTFEILLKLFDAMPAATLLYGCELWGHLSANDVDNVQINFFRKIFKIRQACPSVALYGEFNRVPMSLFVKLRVLRYWLKLRSKYPRNCLPVLLYENLKHAHIYFQRNSWLSFIQNILDSIGMQDLFYSCNDIEIDIIIGVARKRLVNDYSDTWMQSLNVYSSLDLYVEYKAGFGFDDCFSIIKNKRHLICFIRFRLRSHNLEIERGRYTQPVTPRWRRFCIRCQNDVVDDELHFLLVCPSFVDNRSVFIPRKFYALPSRTKVINLMKSNDPVIINGLAKFLYFSGIC